MTKFKVGDRVRAKDSGQTMYAGKEFIVQAGNSELFTNAVDSRHLGLGNLFAEYTIPTSALELVDTAKPKSLSELKAEAKKAARSCPACGVAEGALCKDDCARAAADRRPSFIDMTMVRPVPRGCRACTICGEPEWLGRRIVGIGGACGDCLAGGVELSKQPTREPEPVNYHAWQTPSWDDVG